MPTLYDELGLPPTATAAELHRAYRERARRLHPDVAGEDDSTADAMRRLNDAWRVLGDPARRRDYDRTLAPPPPAARDDGADGAEEEEPEATPAGRPHVPALLVVVALLVAIVVVTAYASSPQAPDRGTSPVGRCLVVRPGYEAFEQCGPGQRDEVVAEVRPDQACPPGTARHQVQQRSQIVCLARS